MQRIFGLCLQQLYKKLFFPLSLHQSSFACLKVIVPPYSRVFTCHHDHEMLQQTPMISYTLCTSRCITAVTCYSETHIIICILHTGDSLSLGRQDLSCAHLAHHELGSIIVITIIIVVTNIIIMITITGIIITVITIITVYAGVCHPPQGTAAAPNKSQHVCQRTQPWYRGVGAVCKVWV